MPALSEIALALFIMSDLALAGASRLRFAIRLVAVQGWIVGGLPLLLWNWQGDGCPGARIWAIAAVNTLVKGVVLPMLLTYAVRKERADANGAFDAAHLLAARLGHAEMERIARFLRQNAVGRDHRLHV